jgi:serine/threonine-protein kinase
MDEPRILDRYRLIERLAVGGSAEVWRAHDEQLDRPVAVKRLHPHLLPDPASRARLAAEARAVAALSHPVIVGVYDVDQSGEWPAIVMELVDGEPLSARIARDGALDAAEAAAIAADVAEALYHAHQRGVIHRDVKPGNVLIGRDGRTRLVDFGIARSLADASARLTLTGTVMGTLHAMAPEQLADEPITPRTDLYGLGVVLHEMLTGSVPYSAGSPVALAAAQRAGPPTLDGVEPGLAAVTVACLAHDPTVRPLHAGALAAALRDWLAGDPAAALAMRPAPTAAEGRRGVDAEAVTRTMPRAVTPAPVAAPRSAMRERPRRRSLAPVLLVALVALLGAAAMAAMAADRSVGDSAPSLAASPAASPAATPAPPWIEELAAAIAAACGTDATTEAATLAGLDEEEARRAADDAIEACVEAGDGGGNGNAGDKDKGKGKGNGNGNGRGNDD